MWIYEQKTAAERGWVRVWHNSDDPVRNIQECEEKHPNKRRGAKAAAAPRTVGTNNRCGKTWDHGLHRTKPRGRSSAKHRRRGRCGGSRHRQYPKEDHRQERRNH